MYVPTKNVCALWWYQFEVGLGYLSARRVVVAFVFVAPAGCGKFYNLKIPQQCDDEFEP